MFRFAFPQRDDDKETVTSEAVVMMMYCVYELFCGPFSKQYVDIMKVSHSVRLDRPSVCYYHWLFCQLFPWFNNNELQPAPTWSHY